MAAISMPRSLTPVLLLLALSAATVPAALAIRPAGSDGDAVAKACNGTANITECVNVLNTNPDGVPPRRLAELAYSYLVKDGEALYKETQAAAVTAATIPKDVQSCKSFAKEVNDVMKYYYNSVVRFVPEESKKRFDEAKSNLDELLAVPSSMGTMTCPELPVLAKVQTYEDLQMVTQTLMIAADEPPKDPKKEEAAKSVKAPAA